MFPVFFPTDIHQLQDNENGDENSLDDQCASNNKDLNILNTTATTQNNAYNIGTSSSGDILIALKHWMAIFHQRPVPTYHRKQLNHIQKAKSCHNNI